MKYNKMIITSIIVTLFASNIFSLELNNFIDLNRCDKVIDK